MNTEINNLTRSVSQIANYLWQKGWAERSAGNISINITHLASKIKKKTNEFKESKLDREYPELNGMLFFVTATGKRMRDIAKRPSENSCIIKITDHGRKYRIINASKKNKDIKPTSELSTHLAIHEIIKKNKRKSKVIIHTHSSELIALTQITELKNEEKLNHLLLGMHPETIMFIPKGVGFVPYQVPGTIEIAESTIKSFKKHDLILWEKHGVFAVGEDINDTFDSIDMVAKAAQIFFMCRSAGFIPEGLTDDQIKELKDKFKM